MIVGVIVIVLAVVSARVRRWINGAAMLVVCAIVWTLAWVASRLESSRRPQRLVGVVALGLVLLTGWKAGELVITLVRRLP